ncbi:MAG: endonuclease/exonuclease/phosphatase family protein [Gaiellaceae bacterium]
MRVLSYNIWDGGGGRLASLSSVLEVEQPDAVALQEVTQASAAVLGDTLGMAVTFGEGNGIFDLHVAWLTRLPVRRSRNHRLAALSKSLLEVETDGLRLFTIHLASRHEEKAYPRAGEVAAILDVLSPVEGPHLLVGDLNALEPGDEVGTPPAGVVPRGEAVAGAPRGVLAPLRAAGYVDCYRALHPGEPGSTYPADAPWLRLDYAFASGDLAARVHACEVAVGPMAAGASDHLPLRVVIG